VDFLDEAAKLWQVIYSAMHSGDTPVSLIDRKLREAYAAGRRAGYEYARISAQDYGAHIVAYEYSALAAPPREGDE
jgi:hypothetical protein